MPIIVFTGNLFAGAPMLLKALPHSGQANGRPSAIVISSRLSALLHKPK
jgi:hypothetical protein